MHQCSLSEHAKVQGLGDGFKVLADIDVPRHGIEGFKVPTIFQLAWYGLHMTPSYDITLTIPPEFCNYPWQVVTGADDAADGSKFQSIRTLP